MNTVRYFMALLLCGVSLLCSGWFLHLVINSDDISSQVRVNRVLAFIFFLVLSGLLFYLAEYFRKSVKWLPQEPDQRPVVRVWTHNGVTAVCTEEDYQLWWAQNERYRRVTETMFPPISHILEKPAPTFTMFFSDRTLVPDSWKQEGKSVNPDDWRTGDNSELSKLIMECRAEKTELFVPQSSYQWLHCETKPISLMTAWKLVHGPNAEPPTTS